MPNRRSPTLHVRARGAIACFTRPEMKVERVSYPVMTPSAARGILEAILWKPAFRWRVEAVRVLASISYLAFRRNEVSSKARRPPAALVDEGGDLRPYFAEDYRAQRNTVALRDVDYVIEARMELTSRAADGDAMAKFVGMFQRRLEKGQHFHQPYLGCREMAADVLPADGAPEPIPETRDLGLMLWDIDFGRPEGNVPRFFHAHLEGGVLRVPDEPPPLAPPIGDPASHPAETGGSP